MNLKDMPNIQPAIYKLHTMEAELSRSQEVVEILESTITRALHNAEQLRQGLELKNASELFNGYTNLKYSYGHFDLQHKLLQEIEEISNSVSERMQKVFDLLHGDLVMRA